MVIRLLILARCGEQVVIVLMGVSLMCIDEGFRKVLVQCTVENRSCIACGIDCCSYTLFFTDL